MFTKSRRYGHTVLHSLRNTGLHQTTICRGIKPLATATNASLTKHVTIRACKVRVYSTCMHGLRCTFVATHQAHCLICTLRRYAAYTIMRLLLLSTHAALCAAAHHPPVLPTPTATAIACTLKRLHYETHAGLQKNTAHGPHAVVVVRPYTGVALQRKRGTAIGDRGAPLSGNKTSTGGEGRANCIAIQIWT